jgi:hypothetical protein
MSNDPTAGTPDAGQSAGFAEAGVDPAGRASAQPSEAELRAAYEAELSRITSAELMLQATVSLLNVGSFRLAPPAPPQEGDGAPSSPGDTAAPGVPSPSDLEQARDAIDGARALLQILERSVPDEIAPLRNALSQLQMAYARAAQAAGPPAPSGGSAPPPGDSSAGGSGGGTPSSPGEQPPSEGQRRPGPAESSGRLWVPGS